MYLPTTPMMTSSLTVRERCTSSRQPTRSTGRAPRPEAFDDVVAQTGLLERQRHAVDRVRGLERHHRATIDVAEQGDLVARVLGHRVVGARADDVGLNTDRAQLFDAVLRGLGLELGRRAHVRQQRDVDEQASIRLQLAANLAQGLQERQTLDVADGAADLGDDDLGVGQPGDALDALLDLVRDMRHHLDRAAQKVPAPLATDHRRVDLAGRDVGRTGQVLVDEALVVTEVEVGLGAVVGDEHLAVLIRRHGARIDIDVGVELQDANGNAARLEQSTNRRDGDPLTDRRNYAT